VTNGGGSARPSKNERREAAREKARQLREQQRKRERRNKLLLGGGIGLASLAIIAVIGFIIFTSIRPAGPGPANMASDGIKIGQSFEAVPTAALPADEDPVPSAANEPNVVDIQIYVDYMCPICGLFEEVNKEQIESWVSEGSATIEYHPISILNPQSQGTRYSTRSANAAACVANYSPNAFFEFNNLLFENQPQEQTPGLDDATLIELANEAGVTAASNVETCINEGRFNNWVADATSRALTGPIPNSDVEKVTGTPTVIVNGVQYNSSTFATTGTFDAEEFAAFVLAQSAAPANTPSPTPTPTETPAA
jgi:protein-disulfide isomerase